MATDSTDARLCRRYRITGRVQGVYFRGSTRTVAKRLHLSGYAVNRPDGSVEVLACGDADAFEAFEEWLHRGPTGARVDDVRAEDHPDDGCVGFTTG